MADIKCEATQAFGGLDFGREVRLPGSFCAVPWSPNTSWGTPTPDSPVVLTRATGLHLETVWEDTAGSQVVEGSS